MTQQITPSGVSEQAVIPASQANLAAPAWASHQTNPKSARQRALMGSTGLWECSLAAVSTGTAALQGLIDGIWCNPSHFS